MDRQTSAWKVHLYAIALSAAVAIGSVCPATAAEWESMTSLKEVRRMRLIDDTVWAATSGGLLAIANPDEPGLVFDNLSELGTTDIRDIIADNAGRKWVVGFGRLVRFTAGQSRVFLFELNNELLGLWCLSDDGDDLWVGTDSGLVLFSKVNDGGQIQDSYQLFGDLNANPRVQDILIDGDTIWLATTAGLAMADKSDPIQLNAPSAWTVFDVDRFPELGTSDIRRVTAYESEIWVGAATGLYRLQRTDTSASFVRELNIPATVIVDLKVEQDTLFVYYTWNMRSYDGARWASPLVSGPAQFRTGLNTGVFRWIGTGGFGLYFDRDTTGVPTEYPYTGRVSNDARAVGWLDSELAIGYPNRQVELRDNETWITYDLTAGANDIAFEPSGVLWVATEGNGITRIDGDSIAVYNESNSSLQSYEGLPGYVVVRSLDTDGRYIFATCRRAANGYPVAIGNLAALDSPSGWDSVGISDSLIDNVATAVDFFSSRLAVGTGGTGVFVCNVGTDPFSRPEGTCQQFTLEDGLNGDVINVVRYSPTGILWVGTSFGLSRWDLDRFVSATPPGIGRNITALEFDGRGNAWVGAAEGLARIDAVTGTSTVYTSQTSGLLSDDIRDLALDPSTGDLYIATAAGTSVLRSGVTQLTSSLDGVVAYPNPFIIRSGHESLKFNFAHSATVRLFSVAGELVDEFSVNTPWHGRNQKGEPVASGVYLFILTDSEGNVGRGKVLVIRER